MAPGPNTYKVFVSSPRAPAHDTWKASELYAHRSPEVNWDAGPLRSAPASLLCLWIFMLDQRINKELPYPSLKQQQQKPKQLSSDPTSPPAMLYFLFPFYFLTSHSLLSWSCQAFAPITPPNALYQGHQSPSGC